MLTELGVGELREQAHGSLLQVTGQAGPDGRAGGGRRRRGKGL